jgi:hypothetical protein
MRKLLIMDEGILGRRINRLQSTVMIMVFHHLGARFSFSSPLTCEICGLGHKRKGYWMSCWKQLKCESMKASESDAIF